MHFTSNAKFIMFLPATVKSTLTSSNKNYKDRLQYLTSQYLFKQILTLKLEIH